MILYIGNLNDFDVHDVEVTVHAEVLGGHSETLQKTIGDMGKRVTATVLFESDYARDFEMYDISIRTSEGVFSCNLYG